MQIQRLLSLHFLNLVLLGLGYYIGGMLRGKAFKVKIPEPQRCDSEWSGALGTTGIHRCRWGGVSSAQISSINPSYFDYLLIDRSSAVRAGKKAQ